MKNIKDEFVTFDTAKLAKEKGFDELCKRVFDTEGTFLGFTGVELMRSRNKNSLLHLIDTNTEDFEYPNYYCTAPTQSLLQRWLREVHKIDVIPAIYKGEYYNWVTVNSKTHRYTDKILFSTYEESLEKGLQQALTLIK